MSVCFATAIAALGCVSQERRDVLTRPERDQERHFLRPELAIERDRHQPEDVDIGRTAPCQT